MPVQVDLLANLPLFDGLSTVELEELGSHLESAEVDAKQTIIKEGDQPDHPIYILISGNVEVIKYGIDRRDHVISTLAAPSVFGEIEVLARRPAIATVCTVSKCRLALLNRGVFEELCNNNRSCILKVVKNLATTLAYRLAATDGRLAAYFSLTQNNDPEAIGQVHKTLYSSWHTAVD